MARFSVMAVDHPRLLFWTLLAALLAYSTGAALACAATIVPAVLWLAPAVLFGLMQFLMIAWVRESPARSWLIANGIAAILFFAIGLLIVLGVVVSPMGVVAMLAVAGALFFLTLCALHAIAPRAAKTIAVLAIVAPTLLSLLALTIQHNRSLSRRDAVMNQLRLIGMQGAQYGESWPSESLERAISRAGWLEPDAQMTLDFEADTHDD